MNHDNTFANDIVKSQYDIFISEYKQGKTEGELQANESFSQIKKEFERLSDSDMKLAYILSQIIRFKKASIEFYADEFYQMLQRAKEYAYNSKIDISNEDDEIINFFKYTVDFYRFQKTPDEAIQAKLLLTRIKVLDTYKAQSLILKFEYFFEILNSICKIESFYWEWSNFETGLMKLQFNQAMEKFTSQKEHELEIENLKHTQNFQVEDLESEIDGLNREITHLNGRIETINDYYDKYYYRTQTVLYDTYFGDNQPFLFNLFNFLKRNNLFAYGWSYFYSCMIEGNNEIIPLETSAKNVKPIGRIFYHLKDLLVKHYKTEPEKFFRAKFYINNEPLSSHFFTNHVYKRPDAELLPFIGEIDAFFENQKKIYLKNNN